MLKTRSLFTVEKKGNGLLCRDKLTTYTSIILVRDQTLFQVPIIRGSGKYAGTKQNLVNFTVPRKHRLTKAQLNTWHKRKSKSKRKKRKKVPEVVEIDQKPTV